MKKISKLAVLMWSFLFMLFLLTGCTKESEAQNVFGTKRFVNFGDTTFSQVVSGYSTIVVSLSDSSNSTVDTFKVYLVSPHGDEVLAAMTKSNDTSGTGALTVKSTGTVFPGDGTTGIYQINAKGVYMVKIVRTNVASISGTAVTGKVSYVYISASRSSGSIKTHYPDYAFNENNNILPGAPNPGFY